MNTWGGDVCYTCSPFFPAPIDTVQRLMEVDAADMMLINASLMWEPTIMPFFGGVSKNESDGRTHGTMGGRDFTVYPPPQD